MRVPISWLRKFVPIELPIEDLTERLTSAGIEVEQIDGVGAHSPLVTVVELLEKELIVADRGVHRLIVGDGERRHTLVSAAPNVRDTAVGARFALALPQARLFDGEASGCRLYKVVPREIYGVETEGVLCSERELGVGEDHEGLRVLSATATPGGDVATALSAEEGIAPMQEWRADRILELAILPNIARCQSILGVAKEVAALTGAPPPQAPAGRAVAIESGPLDPRVTDPKACSRFSVLECDQLQVVDSPEWMQRDLSLAGVDPINNIVDAANYVMLELGQPMHTYDAERIESPILGTRFAHADETLKTLDQLEEESPRKLPEGVLVIDCEGEAVGIAGIMGGLDSAIQDPTTRVVIECANFDYFTVRKGQRLLDLFTDASARFSRAVDPELTIPAIQRFVALLDESCPQLTTGRSGHFAAGAYEAPKIRVSLDEIEAALGSRYAMDEVVGVLERVGLSCAAIDGGATLEAEIPSSRLDLALPCDLIEEVARLAGYDRMPGTMPVEPIPMPAANVERMMRERCRDALVQWGLQDVLSYTMTHAALEDRLYAGEPTEPPAREYVRLVNPIGQERSVLRRSLLPTLLETTAFNLRSTSDCHLFEIGTVMHPREAGGLPEEKLQLAIVMTGLLESASMHRSEPRLVDFFDLKHAIESLLAALHLPVGRFVSATGPPFQPGLGAQLFLGENLVGSLGAVHPLVAEAFEIKKRKLFAAELDLQWLLQHAQRNAQFVAPPSQPSIELDVSVEVRRDCVVEEILSRVRKECGELLLELGVFDVYEGEAIDAEHKAVAFRMLLNAGDRTLAMEEAEALRDRVVRRLASDLKAKLRG